MRASAIVFGAVVTIPVAWPAATIAVVPQPSGAGRTIVAIGGHLRIGLADYEAWGPPAEGQPLDLAIGICDRLVVLPNYRTAPRTDLDCAAFHRAAAAIPPHPAASPPIPAELLDDADAP